MAKEVSGVVIAFPELKTLVCTELPTDIVFQLVTLRVCVIVILNRTLLVIGTVKSMFHMLMVDCSHTYSLYFLREKKLSTDFNQTWFS